jgi:hypothetical protein
MTSALFGPDGTQPPEPYDVLPDVLAGPAGLGGWIPSLPAMSDTIRDAVAAALADQPGESLVTPTGLRTQPPRSAVSARSARRPPAGRPRQDAPAPRLASPLGVRQQPPAPASYAPAQPGTARLPSTPATMATPAAVAPPIGRRQSGPSQPAQAQPAPPVPRRPEPPRPAPFRPGPTTAAQAVWVQPVPPQPGLPRSGQLPPSNQPPQRSTQRSIQLQGGSAQAAGVRTRQAQHGGAQSPLIQRQRSSGSTGWIGCIVVLIFLGTALFGSVQALIGALLDLIR